MPDHISLALFTILPPSRISLVPVGTIVLALGFDLISPITVTVAMVSMTNPSETIVPEIVVVGISKSNSFEME